MTGKASRALSDMVRPFAHFALPELKVIQATLSTAQRPRLLP